MRNQLSAAASLASAAPRIGLHRSTGPSRAWEIRTVKPVTYTVRLVDDLFGLNSTDLVKAGQTQRVSRIRRFVVLDAEVDWYHGDRIRKYFDHHNVETRFCVIRVNEQLKTVDTLLDVCRQLDEFGINRRVEPIIAIGGGVLCDVVGLLASLYRRGTPYVRVPTTLVGLVDAGVGAKTGVNFGEHKNRLDTYFPSSHTLLDRSFLATLDSRHISNGLAEILKIGLIKDLRLFELLEQHGSELIETRLQAGNALDAVAVEVLDRAIQGMLEELQPNLWEHKLERLVDYGHSFSPLIEMRALPELLHGEAVTVDMALTTCLARRRGLVSRRDQDRIFATMRALRLPLWHPVCEPATLIAALRDTVRHRDGLQRIPLPLGIGQAYFANDVTDDEIAQACDDVREEVCRA
ncbi:sedoheptulose 7-phosphate cyclase [Carbonactinospora thermoautotrophica]|uniref:sedoheptulose 7-phosphate cyclase n=1 Tax=Carbonactinospora thermoautotrophica TaxID=1469144 RepID=UPI002270110B|nr:sedoheptulose 7-phosphate cyclase [Carbonactinospora thermoautotrophica]